MKRHAPASRNTPQVELPLETQQLIAAVAELPQEYRSNVQPILDRVVESTRRRKRILSLVQEALGQLRLDMKYLMFDLEATRRERDSFQQQLEGHDDDGMDQDE